MRQRHTNRQTDRQKNKSKDGQDQQSHEPLPGGKFSPAPGAVLIEELLGQEGRGAKGSVTLRDLVLKVVFLRILLEDFFYFI